MPTRLASQKAIGTYIYIYIYVYMIERYFIKESINPSRGIMNRFDLKRTSSILNHRLRISRQMRDRFCIIVEITSTTVTVKTHAFVNNIKFQTSNFPHDL